MTATPVTQFGWQSHAKDAMQSSHTSRVGLRWLLGTVVAIVLAACTSAADPEIIRDPPTYSIDVRGTLVSSETGLPSDPITIDSARVEGGILAASVTHGGGCANHTYQLVIASAWMESSPVQVSARIAHDANHDACRALLRQDLRMSLRPLADAYRAAYHEEHGAVSIKLAGTTGALLYEF